MNKRARAVFLDRDGTLIADKGYISRPAQVELLPDVPPALAILRGLGFELIVISNQSGVGRGLMTVEDVDRVNLRLHELLSAQGVVLTDFYYCPHSPEERCACRKPRPGLLCAAMKDYGIDAVQSFFVGDKWTDAEAAQAAGVRPVLLSSAYSRAGGRGHAVSGHPQHAVIPVIFAENLLSWTRQLERGGIT